MSSGWPQGPTPLMAARCAGCWFQPAGYGGESAEAARLAKEALNRELYVACHREPRAVCAGFYELFTTASLRMVHMLWGFTLVDPGDGRRPRCGQGTSRREDRFTDPTPQHR